MKKILLFLITLLLTTSNTYAEEKKMILKLKNGDVEIELFPKIAPKHVERFEKLANERLILRKMEQYKIPNSLRLTIGNKKSNEHFIQTIRDILK